MRGHAVFFHEDKDYRDEKEIRKKKNLTAAAIGRVVSGVLIP